MCPCQVKQYNVVRHLLLFAPYANVRFPRAVPYINGAFTGAEAPLMRWTPSDA